jgi:hypothetical protein
MQAARALGLSPLEDPSASALPTASDSPCALSGSRPSLPSPLLPLGPPHSSTTDNGSPLPEGDRPDQALRTSMPSRYRRFLLLGRMPLDRFAIRPSRRPWVGRKGKRSRGTSAHAYGCLAPLASAILFSQKFYEPICPSYRGCRCSSWTFWAEIPSLAPWESFHPRVGSRQRFLLSGFEPGLN